MQSCVDQAGRQDLPKNQEREGVRGQTPRTESSKFGCLRTELLQERVNLHEAPEARKRERFPQGAFGTPSTL